MKEPKKMFQFRIADYLRDFLNGRNPSNTSQAVTEIIEEKKNQEDEMLERYAVFDEPEKSLSEIKLMNLKGETISPKYYEFMVEHIHSLARRTKFSPSESEGLEFVAMIRGLHDAIIASGRKVDMADHMAGKLGEESLIKGLDVMAERITEHGVNYVVGEHLLRALNLMLGEPAMRFIEVHKVLGQHLNTLIKFTDEAIKLDAEAQARRIAEEVEHESKVMNAFSHQESNKHPIAYGNGHNLLRASVCTASLYCDPRTNQVVVVLEETGIGYASITNFIEQIAKTVIHKFLMDEDLQTVQWYQIESGLFEKLECDMVRFGVVTKGGVANPVWLKVDMDGFKSMLSKLEPLSV
jgi:hypothetical protein